MKKATIKVREVEDNDMRAEYDFRGGVRANTIKRCKLGIALLFKKRMARQ